MATDEINLDFAKDEVNGVGVFRPSICSVGRQQLFLISPSSYPLPLPFPDPTAGSVSAPTTGLSPSQRLSQPKLWEVCPVPRKRGTQDLPFHWLFPQPLGLCKQPWSPDVNLVTQQERSGFHNTFPRHFCPVHDSLSIPQL